MDKKAFFSLWYVQVLVVLILIGIVLSLGAYTKLTLREANYGSYGAPTISVRGEGEVVAVPDIGAFSFSVMAEGVDAATAQSDSAAKINEITAYLKEVGVSESDVKTSGYNLNPKYRYESVNCPAGNYCPSNPVIDGYQVSQTIEVKVRDLTKSGDLITAVGDRGATNISGLRFTIDDESELKAQARENAIVDAQEKADILAKTLGVKLVRITSYYEEEFYGGYDASAVMAKAESLNSATPNMPTGESTVTSVVNIGFEVK